MGEGALHRHYRGLTDRVVGVQQQGRLSGKSYGNETTQYSFNADSNFDAGSALYWMSVSNFNCRVLRFKINKIRNNHI